MPQVSITVGPINRPGPPPSGGDQPAVRSDSGVWLEDHLIDIVALSIAAGSFWQAGTCLVLVLAGCLIIGAVRSAAADGRITGADLVAVPSRGLSRALRLLSPGSLIKGAVLIVTIVGLSIAVPAVLSALPWLLAHGSEGALVAARLGARSHAVQFAVAGLCYLAVRGTGSGRASRTAELKRRTGRMSEGGLSGLAVGVLLVGILVATVPKSGGGMFSGADGLGWVPSSFRASVDELRDEIVTAELDALGSCLGSELGTGWSGIHSEGNKAEEKDVIRLTADHDPSSEEIVVVVLSAHNQAAPWVEQVDLVGPDETLLLSVDRRKLRSDVPVASPESLRSAVRVGEVALATPLGASSRSSLLTCSVSIVL